MLVVSSQIRWRVPGVLPQNLFLTVITYCILLCILAEYYVGKRSAKHALTQSEINRHIYSESFPNNKFFKWYHTKVNSTVRHSKKDKRSEKNLHKTLRELRPFWIVRHFLEAELKGKLSDDGKSQVLVFHVTTLNFPVTIHPNKWCGSDCAKFYSNYFNEIWMINKVSYEWWRIMDIMKYDLSNMLEM